MRRFVAGTVDGWGLTVQRSVRAVVVVAVQPAGRFVAHLFEIAEGVHVQHLAPEGPVEPLDVRVVCRLAGFDGIQLDAVPLGSGRHHLAHQLRPIVRAQLPGVTVFLCDLVEHPRHPL